MRQSSWGVKKIHYVVVNKFKAVLSVGRTRKVGRVGGIPTYRLRGPSLWKRFKKWLRQSLRNLRRLS